MLGKTQIIRKNRGRPQRYLQCYVLEKRAGHEVPCNTGIRKSVCTVRNIVDRLKRDDDKPLQDNHTLPSPPLTRQIPSELYLTRYLNNLVPSKRTLLILSSLSSYDIPRQDPTFPVHPAPMCTILLKCAFELNETKSSCNIESLYIPSPCLFFRTSIQG